MMSSGSNGLTNNHSYNRPHGPERPAPMPREVVVPPMDPGATPAGTAGAHPGDGVDRPAQPAHFQGREPARAEAKPPEMDEATKKALAEVQSHTVPELMTMLRTGKLPSSILESPEALQLMMSRVQEFSRLLQLITNMMQVHHETSMAIIRNIRP